MRCDALAIVVHCMCLASMEVSGDEWVIHIGYIIVEIESCLLFNQKYYKPNVPLVAESRVVPRVRETISPQY